MNIYETKTTEKITKRIQKALKRIAALYEGYSYSTIFLEGGVLRYINVHAPTLQENRANDKKHPMITVRTQDNADEYENFHHVEILGPSILSYTPDDPLPDTNGRAICYVHTKAALLCVIVDYQHNCGC